MASHHDPFKALSPVDWTAFVDDGNEKKAINKDRLTELLSTTFENAQAVINSIPVPASVAAVTKAAAAETTATTGRARSQTDSAVRSNSDFNIPSILLADSSVSRRDAVTSELLRKEWKHVKISPRDNPLNISVYKLSAKDGKGSWFARRSIHHPFSPTANSDTGSAADSYNISFDKWRLALQKEFTETLARTQGEPGTGNIRGIGAEKRIELVELDGVGVVELFQVSARFPGPTTPRDFVTLLLMPDHASSDPTGEQKRGKGRKPRQFMLVSKPCQHPDCPPRSGFIRGQYESVEVIREIPLNTPLRRTRSSVDVIREELTKPIASGTENSRIAREAMLRSASKKGGAAEYEDSFPLGDEEVEQEMAIEWLMVTRSDPGGSVPRFMVERGTPGGILNDANKFLEWLSTKSMEDIATGNQNEQELTEDGVEAPSTQKEQQGEKEPTEIPARTIGAEQEHHGTKSQNTEPQPSGFYGMIAGALEAAGSAVVNKMYTLASTPVTGSEGNDSDAESDISSTELSYASAEEGEDYAGEPLDKSFTNNSSAELESSTRSARSTISEGSMVTSATPTQQSKQHERDLRKLQDRRRRAQEKLERAQERQAAKKQKNGSEGAENDKEAQAIARLREKHERELAKQEERYQRDLRRLAEKRRAEEKKAEERQRKATEREERQNIQRELERTRADRDLALKEIEILKDQVGQLQSQNTRLVAQIGRESKGSLVL
ncbi:hypothetical protein B0T24DRAFT_154487 [Lasiosphaeria ovina]|uniref:DUF3074 domain-containing protein n=1 Tax=Lasiosphaeria ovina TaxID=92902 RepID=A0AAE0KNA9_9PEZI|nr:hypothetical protein B0T24DRAFT_154487 [Lasiosphaeria ovina]